MEADDSTLISSVHIADIMDKQSAAVVICNGQYLLWLTSNSLFVPESVLCMTLIFMLHKFDYAVYRCLGSESVFLYWRFFYCSKPQD